MSSTMQYVIHRLGAGELDLMDAMLDVFGKAFHQEDIYGTDRPGPAYLRRLLGSEQFIALVAMRDQQVVGALAAYELQKFEQERSEIYIYDLAVAADHRRQGVATAMILKLREIAAAGPAYVIFVQADPVDNPAISLYSKLGLREEVLHFDISVVDEGDRP